MGAMSTSLTPSTHVFFATGLPSSSTARFFFPDADSISGNGLLTSSADGVSSMGDPITTTLLAIGVVNAAFASRDPSTARRFTGEELASMLLFLLFYLFPPKYLAMKNQRI